MEKKLNQFYNLANGEHRHGTTTVTASHGNSRYQLDSLNINFDSVKQLKEELEKKNAIMTSNDSKMRSVIVDRNRNTIDGSLSVVGGPPTQSSVNRAPTRIYTSPIKKTLRPQSAAIAPSGLGLMNNAIRNNVMPITHQRAVRASQDLKSDNRFKKPDIIPKMSST
jgi:hypothetical protein